MTKRKLPRDSRGIIFYGLGWLIGSIAKLVWIVVRSIAYGIYTIYKRDQFNRQLRLAAADAEDETSSETRKFGREKLRFLAAGLGLTNDKWHFNSVKIRRRLVDAVNSANVFAADDSTVGTDSINWEKEVFGLLFSNFDQTRLTADVEKKRRFRLRRSSEPKDYDEVVSEDSSVSETEITNGFNQDNFESENSEKWVG